MPALRSRTSTHDRSMVGARVLWRATGITSSDFGRPIIAVANSFTQPVPGHIHLRDMGELVLESIRQAGAVGREFSTITVNDGIAMEHGGMLYSLPSRELIVDAMEYMVNVHCADALVYISNCDKITPGMLLAAFRLNIPTMFVSGGSMEADRAIIRDGQAATSLNLINAMTAAVGPNVSDGELWHTEASAYPTCGSCSGVFTADSMNYLLEATGLAQPGSGSTLATAAARRDLFVSMGRLVIDLCRRWYDEDDPSILPLSITTKSASSSAMYLDVAMGRSTNTVPHLLATTQEARVDFDQDDTDAISRLTPRLSKVASSSERYFMGDIHHAGGIPAILGELRHGGRLDEGIHAIHSPSLERWLADWGICGGSTTEEAVELFHVVPGGIRTTVPFSSIDRWGPLDLDSASGYTRSVEHPHTADDGLAVLRGSLAPDGAIVKTAGVPEHQWEFTGTAFVTESQEETVESILGGRVKEGGVVIVRYEGPKDGPGIQEMLYPTSYLKELGLGLKCALITDDRFSSGSSGLLIGHASPEVASGGPITLVRTGGKITVFIPNRSIALSVPDEGLAARRVELEAGNGYRPATRQQQISAALRIYGSLAQSTDKEAARRFNG